MNYVNLQADDINLALFTHFERRQTVTLCWRQQGGAWVIREDPFIDDWSAADWNALIARSRKRFTVAASFSARLPIKSFWALRPSKRLCSGKTGSIWICRSFTYPQTRAARASGVPCLNGRSDGPGEHGAKKLYISAHSAVESQAFYRAMGCVDAQEPDPEHIRLEPFDRQLECKL